MARKFSDGDKAIVKNTGVRVTINSYDTTKRKYLVSDEEKMSEYYSSRSLLEIPGPSRHKTVVYIIHQIVQSLTLLPDHKQDLLRQLEDANIME